MGTPRSRAEQRFGHHRGELLRGCGLWPSWGIECALEPPFEPFVNGTPITTWDLCVNGWEAPYQGQFADRLKRWFAPVTTKPFDRYFHHEERSALPSIISLHHYAEDDVTYGKAEQFLLALSAASEPVAFELFGIGESTREGAGLPRVEVRFAVGGPDVSLVLSQLHSHYPRSAVTCHELDDAEEDWEWSHRLRGGKEYEDPLFVVPLQLAYPYCFPIRTYRTFDTDPLGVAIAVLDELKQDEWGLVQVLFRRATQPWTANLRLACEDPYRPGKPIDPSIDLRAMEDKLSTPLYAVAVTLAANTPTVLSALAAWVHAYEGPKNELAIRTPRTWAEQWGDDPPKESLWRDALYLRETIAPGMLLSAHELTGLVRLPSPDLPAERLLRLKSQTRRPPKSVMESSMILLGENTHRGEVRPVAIPPDLRPRHCYIAGASGTGKSTLLLNMILQDIGAGHGVGVLDPHGDLVKAVLRRIPKDRWDDVILFDPADKEYPFALNILEARNDAERERIAAETIMALERYFPSSWGPRLERILTYTIHTVLHAVPGATLADVERMLTEDAFRREVVGKTQDSQYLQFWHHQFPFFPKNAVDPVLNKISPFLLNGCVRNIICQRQSAIDFDRLLNDGKILLANLSTGLLTEKIAGTFGSFLVTKIVNAAMRRAAIPEDARRPWYLYVDEFQAFMNLSMGFERILAEARKYKLVLAGLANQYVGQLSPQVRQAVFGNVGSFAVFRLGTDDAHLVAKELGAFTAEDILNLELGQAIARVGGSASAFNLRTAPPPPLPPEDPTAEVVKACRHRYAKSRAKVERELHEVQERAERTAERTLRGTEPTDPSEDDLVT